MGFRNQKKRKEYNKDKVLIYEGEFKNGERNGQGKEFFLNGNLLFNGNYLNGKEMDKVKNFILMVIYYMKGIIYQEKEIMEIYI